MKHVFDTSEVAHIWAQQKQDNGRNAHDNFYFNSKTIFSYGGHFPIATIVDENNVLMTLRTYSNTTAKHIRYVRQAITHKNVIYCYDVPVYMEYLEHTHLKNVEKWKRAISEKFDELGNKRIRNIDSRISDINSLINEFTTYTNFFKYKIKDKELLHLLGISKQSDFVAKARAAKEKTEIKLQKRLKDAEKAYSKYLKLWRNNDSEAIKNMTDKEKDLANFYNNKQTNIYTHLRYIKEQNRIESSKGVKIPVELAKKAFFTLNGCFNKDCRDLSIPVMEYTITESTKDYIKAGCHTIPNEDIRYIANLLNWN